MGGCSFSPGRDAAPPASAWLSPFLFSLFSETEFFTPVTSTTYNFNALKCSDFSALLNLTRNPNLNLRHDLEGRTLLPIFRPCKTGQNGTISNSQKTQPLRLRYLRRSPCRSSHFESLRFLAFFAAIPFASVQTVENRNLRNPKPRLSTPHWCLGFGIWDFQLPTLNSQPSTLNFSVPFPILNS